MATTQTRLSHQTQPSLSTHSHTTDNKYLISANKHDAGVKITRLGLYSNLGMAIAKGVGGVIFNSQAMIADAWHSMVDMASDILTLATVSYSKKPPSSQFPNGYGKIESLGALGVSSMLLIGGCLMCFNSCETLYTHFFLNTAAEGAIHTYDNGHAHGLAPAPSLHAVWLAAGTIFMKEWLYHATMKVAKQRRSSVLASNAIHHRIDSLTGIVTLIAILGANFSREASWLDPVGGFLISLMVIKGGCGNAISAFLELADRGLEEEIKLSIRNCTGITLEKLQNGALVELQDIEGLKSGQNYLINLRLAVPPNWTIKNTGDIEREIRKTIGSNVRGVKRVQVRFVSKENITSSFLDEFISDNLNQDQMVPIEKKYVTRDNTNFMKKDT